MCNVDLRGLIGKYHKESIEELFEDRYSDIKKAIFNSDRKEKFIDELTRQLRIVEKKGKTKLTREKIKSIVKDFVRLHGQAVIKFKEKELKIGEKKSQSKIFLKAPPSGVINLRSGLNTTASGIILPFKKKGQ